MLFDFLSGFNQQNNGTFEEESKRLVLSELECLLEKELTQLFNTHYLALLQEARSTIRKQYSDGWIISSIKETLDYSTINVAEIDLRSPLTLSIAITDWDSHLPSIETRIQVEVKPNLTSTFSLELERIWFYCRAWDQFTSLLLAGHQTALTDMDSSLKLIISQQQEGAELVIEFGEDYQENYQTSTALTCKLDRDALANLRQQFKDVAKW